MHLSCGSSIQSDRYYPHYLALFVLILTSLLIYVFHQLTEDEMLFHASCALYGSYPFSMY